MNDVDRGASRRGWREEEPSPSFRSVWKLGRDSGDPDPTRGRRLAALLSGMVVLVGVLLVILLKPPAHVDFCAVAITDYREPIPPNAFAQEDLERFQDRDTFDDNIRVQAAVDLSEGNRGLVDTLENQLAQVKPGGPNHKWPWSKTGAVVIYLSAHGVVREDGEPCLLDGRANVDPLDSQKWISVREVLNAITSRENLRYADKLLILDAGRMRENWRMGVVHNSFAERLSKVVAEVHQNDPRLYVLNSTRLNQQGWAAPEIAGSFFGYFVAKGLHGAADTSPTDRTVSLAELSAYLEDQVNQLVGKYCGGDQRPASQQPRLWGGSATDEVNEDLSKVRLAYCPRRPAPPEVPSDLLNTVETRRKYLDELERELVQMPDDCLMLATEPLRWAAIRQSLRRLDQLMLAGKAYDKKFNNELTIAKAELKQLRTSLPKPALDTCSIPLARAMGLLTPDELKVAEAAFEQHREKGDSPDDADKPNRLAASAAAWEWLCSSQADPGRENVQQLLQFVDSSRSVPGDASGTGRGIIDSLDAPEIHLVRLFQTGLDWQTLENRLPVQALWAEKRLAELAAQGDVRGRYWVAERLGNDAERLRLARDQLFVGNQRSLNSARETWTALIGPDGKTGSLGEIAQTKQQVDRAYCRRDRCWFELPDLALWLMNHRPTSSPETVDGMIEWIDKLVTLGDQLDQGPRAGSWNALQQNQEEVWATFEKWRDAFRRADKLREEAGVSEDLYDAARLLNTTLLMGEQRRELRERFVEKLAERQEDVRVDVMRPRTSDNADGAGDQQDEAVDALVYLSTSGSHPALQLLDPKASLEPLDPSLEGESRRLATLDRLDEIGGRIRAELAKINIKANELEGETVRKLRDDQTDVPASKAREGISQADRLVRRAAALLANPLAAGGPCRRLLELDSCYLLLWQAERTLQDCWGQGAEGTSGKNCFFHRAVEQHLAAVREMPLHPQARRLAFADRNERLAAAVDDWGLPESPQPTFFDPTQDRWTKFSVSWPHSGDLPPGEAACFIQGPVEVKLAADGSHPPERRRSFDPRTTDTEGTAFDRPIDGDDDSTMWASSFYRGHLRQKPFPWGDQGVTSYFRRPTYEAPTVRVSSEANRVSLVMFVLDCSESMKYEHLIETRPQSRLEIAKNAIGTVIENLDLDHEHFRIGLMAYGHRARWAKVDREYRAVGTVHPSVDVEQLVEIGRINKRALERALDSLRKPLGVTPLYLAMREGIRRMREYNAQFQVASRHLIVLTDGANYTWKGKIVPLGAVKDDLQSGGDDVKLHVVYFGAEPIKKLKGKVMGKEDWSAYENGKKKWAKVKPFIEEIGDVKDVDNPERLVHDLQRSLQLERFYVHQAGTPRPGADRQRLLGESWRVDGLQRDSEYQVRLAGADGPSTKVTLEGGEAIELTLTYGDDHKYRLSHSRYEDEIRAYLEGKVPQYFIATHLPQRQSQNVTFRVSVQNPSPSQFSRRPTHIWAEVRPTPQLPDARTVYYFQDRKFADGVPVPVLELDVQDFPRDTEQANVWLWLSDRPDVYEQSKRLDELVEEPLDYGGAVLSVATTIRDRRTQVVIDERHRLDSQEYPLRVQLEPPADVIRRSYFDSDQRVRHVFEYDSTNTSGLRLKLGRKHDRSEKWVEVPPIPVTVPRS